MKKKDKDKTTPVEPEVSKAEPMEGEVAEAGEAPGKILEVFQKGYKVKDKIIRYAMVKVAVEE